MTCKYAKQFTGLALRGNGYTIGCDYLCMKEESRVYKDGVQRYDPRLFCDKYEPGKSVMEKIERSLECSRKYKARMKANAKAISKGDK